MKMNRKGQVLGKGLTTLVVLFLIVFLMGIFVVVTIWISNNNYKTEVSYTGVSLNSDSILFKPITLNGQTKLLSEELISEFKNNNINSRDLDNYFSNLALNDVSYTNKDLCIFFGVGSYADSDNIRSNGIVPGTFSRFFIEKDSNGKLGAYNYLNILSKIDEVKLNINETRVGLVGYYGGCP